jgi:hypothetical protein
MEIRNLQLQEQQRQKESLPLGVVELPRPTLLPEVPDTTQAKSKAASLLIQCHRCPAHHNLEVEV